MFCVFEGLDGSGKTTLLNHVAAEIQSGSHDWFAERFGGVELLKEPTDLEGGRRIREMLRGGTVPGRMEWLELFLADRADNVGTHIQPGLKRGYLLLQDRYYWSTAAYQGRENEAPTPRDIVEMNEARGFPFPDLLFYLDLSPEKSVERAQARGAVETFETLEQLRVMHRNYEAVMPARALRLDAELPAAKLAAIVLEKIRARSMGDMQ